MIQVVCFQFKLKTNFSLLSEILSSLFIVTKAFIIYLRYKIKSMSIKQYFTLKVTNKFSMIIIVARK